MNRIAPAIAAAAVVVIGAAYILVRAPAAATDPLPRWSCNHLHPPVADSPAVLIQQAGFRDRAALQRFVDRNEAALHWTYSAVQAGLQPAETEALRCFRRRWSGMTPAAMGSTEARLTWRLTSDGTTALASNFELAAADGPSQLVASARACLEQHLFGKTFRVRRSARHGFVHYRGVFPFHRRLRFSSGAAGPGPVSQPLAPS
jgi:hypothetical protein